MPVRDCLLCILIFAAFVAAYLPVWKNLVTFWHASEDYSHGFLIVPLSLYIIWQKRGTLAKTPIYPSWWGVCLVVFSLIVYVVAYFAEVTTLASVSMILALTGVIIYLFGVAFLKQIIFPLFLLLLMIPVPAQVYSAVTIPLQLMVSKASAGAAWLMGIPLYREGNLIHLPDRTLARVVQACSGLRSMIALLTLGAVFGYMTLHSNWLRAILFFSGIPFAILVNIVRVLAMIVAFHYFQYDLTSGNVHTVFGLIIFLLALALIALTKGVLSLWDMSAAKE